LASNIRAAVARKNTTIVALADLAGVSSAHLYDVVRSEKSATVDFLEKVAEALGVEPWQLLRNQDNAVETRARKTRS
jgi:transcriptional regulator with XRE-family HTH domain